MSGPALQRFFVDALGGALEVGLATPDDVLKHVTPDVLAAHLPRPLWAKLIAACLAAPRTDARLVVETLGVPVLAEHIPGAIVWAVIADIAARALGKGLIAAPPPTADAPVAAPTGGKADSGRAAASPATVAPAGKAAGASAAAPATASASTKPLPAVAAASPTSASPRPSTAPPVRMGTNPGITATPTATPPPPPAAGSGATPAGPASVIAASAATTGSQTSTSTHAAPIAGGTGTATVAPPMSAIVDIDFDDDEDDEPAPLEAPPHSPHRAPTVPGPQAMPTRGNGRAGSGAGASSRRPQASAAPRSGSRTSPPSPRRAANSEFDIDTDVHPGKDPASGSAGLAASAIDVPVDDDQLIDWSSSEETVTSGGDVDRKR